MSNRLIYVINWTLLVYFLGLWIHGAGCALGLVEWGTFWSQEIDKRLYFDMCQSNFGDIPSKLKFPEVFYPLVLVFGVNLIKWILTGKQFWQGPGSKE